MVRRGECPTSCAQLSLLLHSAYPAVPILQLGCLIGDLSQPRETMTSWGVRDPGGAVHDRTAGSNRNGRQYSRQRAKAAEAWQGWSWECGQSLAISRSSRYLQMSPAQGQACLGSGIWQSPVSNSLFISGESPEDPLGVCVGYTDPGPGCHGEAGTSRSCWGAFPRSTVSSIALERAKSIPSAQAQEVSKLCCLCMVTRVNARVCPGSLSWVSLCQTDCHQIRPWFKQ